MLTLLTGVFLAAYFIPFSNDRVSAALQESFLMLAGPSLSLPNLLVIGSELGTKKTLTYVGLVVIISAIVGILYGHLL